jgi:hypothetical protein
MRIIPALCEYKAIHTTAAKVGAVFLDFDAMYGFVNF